MTEAPDTHSTPWDTIRSSCGAGRATYHPEWSASMPWCTYFHGTAGRQAATKAQAVAILKTKGCKFTESKKP